MYSDMISQVEVTTRQNTFGDSYAGKLLKAMTKKIPAKKSNQSSHKKRNSTVTSALVWNV